MNPFDRVLARWLTPHRCEVYAHTLAAVMMGGYLVSQLVGPGRSDAAGTLVGADFSAFWIGGRMLLDGKEQALYDFSAQKVYYDALIAPVSTPVVHPYVNPPFFAVAMMPISALPYDWALGVWWSSQLALVVGLAIVFWRSTPGLRVRTWHRTVQLALIFFPTLAWFCYGQNTGWTLGLLSAWYLLARSGQDWRSGWMLGLLFFKPQLGLGPAIILVMQRRYRALAGAVASASSWIALGMICVPDAMMRYLEIAPTLFEFLRRSDYNTWGLLSGFGFGVVLFDDVSKPLGSLVGYGATVAGMLAIAWYARRLNWEPGTREWELTMAGLIALGIVTSPHLFMYDAMLFLLPFAIASSWNPGGREFVLDGGPLLAKSGLLYALSFAGPYLTLGLQSAFAEIGLPRVVPQVTTLAMVLFALELIRAGARRDDHVDDEAERDRNQADQDYL